MTFKIDVTNRLRDQPADRPTKRLTEPFARNYGYDLSMQSSVLKGLSLLIVQDQRNQLLRILQEILSTLSLTGDSQDLNHTAVSKIDTSKIMSFVDEEESEPTFTQDNAASTATSTYNTTFANYTTTTTTSTKTATAITTITTTAVATTTTASTWLGGQVLGYTSQLQISKVMYNELTDMNQSVNH